MRLPIVTILGVEVHRIDFAQLLDQIGVWVVEHHTLASRAAAVAQRSAPSAPAAHQICTVNPEFIVDANRNAEFAAALRQADLRVPDGVGVLWAARLLGSPLPERVTGSDGIYRISERAAQAGWRLFYLGAAPGVAERTAAILSARYRGLTVAGTYGGSPADAEWPEIAQRLLSAQADVVLVAYGHPAQDLWIAAHRHELPCAVAIGVGGAFDFVAGVTVRAPHWMRRVGLEWLHRLLREPWRWRRMTKLPAFVGLVILQRLGLRRSGA